jgi:hypothetical protein
VKRPSPRKRAIVLGVWAVFWFGVAMAGLAIAIWLDSTAARILGLGLFVSGALSTLVLVRELGLRPPES